VKTSVQREWEARCAEEIRVLDDQVHPRDAADLATTLWERLSCREIDPRVAAQRLLDGTLSSGWSDL
jgi:hypothetical protein